MAKKKKDFLLCTCTTKSLVGKKKNFFGGNKCTCDPYPNGMKKGKDYDQVFITSVIK